MFCVYCSKKVKTGSVSCASCGRCLKERLLKCRNCGYLAALGDKFCFMCATEIEFMHVSIHDSNRPGKAPEQNETHRSSKDKPKRWGKLVAAWLVFVLITGTSTFAAYWYYEDIMSFFRNGDEVLLVASNLKPEPLQFILPFITHYAEEAPIYETEPEPEPPAYLPIMFTSTIAAGRGHYLAISHTGHLWSWGINESGQLGIGSTDEYLQPVLVMNNAVSVLASSNRTAAITEDGNLWGFGNNSRGQLGDGTTTNRYLPVLIMENVVFASITDNTSFAITKDNYFWAWGANDVGQLADGTTTDRHSPTFIRSDGLEFAKEIGLIEENAVWQRENLTISGERIVYISANPNVSLVLTEQGYVWGLVGDAIQAVDRWNEDDFFIVMANVKSPIGLVP